MTAKEKAIDLIKKIILADILDKGTPIEKQCALICVEEILETYIDLDPKLNYWKEVKQEINKL